MAFPITDALTLLLTALLLIPELREFSVKSKSPGLISEGFNLPEPPVKLG